MNFFIIFLFEFFFIQCMEDFESKTNTLYFEHDNRYFNASIIDSPLTIELLNQLPLKIGQFSNNNESISIFLDKHINFEGEEKIDILKKGDIYTDGDSLFFYYGELTETNNNNYYFIGNIRNVDDLIKSLNEKPFKNLYLRATCISSIIGNDVAYISEIIPDFYILSYLEFNEIPYLYFGNNYIPLEPYCELNHLKKVEIKCKFSKSEIKKNYFEYKNNLRLFEIIPGYQEKIDTGYNFTFIYEIPHCKEQDTKTHRCVLCKSGKRFHIVNDGKECVYSPFFFYMVIGLPIIDVALIVLFAFLCKKYFDENMNEKYKYINIAIISVIVLVNSISFCAYFL